jgi:hypothetical protein
MRAVAATTGPTAKAKELLRLLRFLDLLLLLLDGSNMSWRGHDDPDQAGGHMYTVELDEVTFNAIQDAARLTDIPPGEVVARLVAKSLASSAAKSVDPAPVQVPPQLENISEPHEWVPIYNDYAGVRTKARFFPLTGRVEIASGPLTGQRAGTPSQAARMVISHYKPDVDPNRNGWTFWVIEDGSNRFIQSIRRIDAPDQQIPPMPA